MNSLIRSEGFQVRLLMIGSVLSCALVGTLVGLKLLGIASRSRKLPELLIGTSLLAYAALSQPAFLVTHALGEEASLGLRMGIVVVRVLAYYFALLGLLLFTWQVFGAGSRWRQAVAAGLAVAAAASAGLAIWANWLQLSANAPLPLYVRIGIAPHYALGFGWASLESLRYYGLMRRRRSLGLADPVVTNRFFVWGAGGGASSLVVFALCVAIATRSNISIADPYVSWFVVFAGFVNALVWWLTFAPPASYQRWIRGNAAAGATDG
jgi:hypothetical protein